MASVLMMYEGKRNENLYKALVARFEEVIEVCFEKEIGAVPEFAGSRSGEDFKWTSVGDVNCIVTQKHFFCLGRRDILSLLKSVHSTLGHRSTSKLWCPVIYMEDLRSPTLCKKLHQLGFRILEPKKKTSEVIATSAFA